MGRSTSSEPCHDKAGCQRSQPGPGAHFCWKLSRKISLGYRAPEAEDALQKLTVPKLQAFLRKHRQKTSGRKAELVQRALNVPA